MNSNYPVAALDRQFLFFVLRQEASCHRHRSAVDMAGNDRGNMRCFEAMGCGAMLVSDAGRYSGGMVDQQPMIVYDDIQQAVARIDEGIRDRQRSDTIARSGHQTVRSAFSKGVQWDTFDRLTGELQ